MVAVIRNLRNEIPVCSDAFERQVPEVVLQVEIGVIGPTRIVAPEILRDLIEAGGG